MIQIYYRHIRSEKLKTLDQAKTGSWVNVVAPAEAELKQLAEIYGLEYDLLQDGLDIHESPRVEIEEGDTYLYTRYCYADSGRIQTAPILIVYSKQHLITISPKPFDRLENLTNGRVLFFTTQKTKLLLQILSEVRNSYSSQLNAISKTIYKIRAGLKKEQIHNRDIIAFIDIEETLNDFISALVPTGAIFRSLLTGRYFKLYEEDEDLIEDLSLGITELIELTKSRLTTIVNVREAYSTIMANNLNRIFRRLTSITILLTIPMVISSIYGMNIALPFMDANWAFWFVMGIITIAVGATIFIFRRYRWF
jgi:magnesium transporter